MTTETAVAKPDPLPIATMEQVLVEGDLSKLTGPMRLTYYRRVCESLDLNPLTKPFDYLTLNGKLRLYPNRTCSDQLRDKRQLSLTIVSREHDQETGLLSIVARATAPSGRFDESLGALSLKGLSGENLANAMMKCETKAKRRVTLSFCGLGWADAESEMGTVPNARPVSVNHETGEIIETTKVETKTGAPSAPLKPVMPAASVAPAGAPTQKKDAGGEAGATGSGPSQSPAARAPARSPAPSRKTVGMKELAVVDEAERTGKTLPGETAGEYLARMDREDEERKAIQAETAQAPPAKIRGPDGRFPRGPKPEDDPWCPLCGGPMHDMRANRKNPKAPEWICQMCVPGHAYCEGLRWPRKADGSDHAAGA